MIIEPQHLYEKLQLLRRSGSVRKGVSTGFPGLDELMLLSKKYLMTLTGMPSCGKSEVLDALATNTAMMHGWKWLYFSPENFPLEEHLKKFVERKLGKPLMSATVRETEDAVEWAQENFAWIDPLDGKFTLDAILETAAERIESGHKLDVLVIDPWNELDHSAQAGQRDDQYISKCLTQIRRFHREYDLLTCVVIHPTKLRKDEKTGSYPVPNLYDCNGGAMWRNKADYGLCVHRHDLSKHEATVYVQKIKFKSMGKVGQLVLDYDWKSGRFKEKYQPDFALPEIDEAPF